MLSRPFVDPIETLGKHALGPTFYLRSRGQHAYSESVADFFEVYVAHIQHYCIVLHICDLHTPCIEPKLCLMGVSPGVVHSGDIRVQKGKVLRPR